jgi:hypothetical protein
MPAELEVKMSVPAMLGTLFIILKLIGVVDWSWWVVLSPFFVQLAVALIYRLTKSFRNNLKK